MKHGLISIPERNGAPATNLYVKILAQNAESAHSQPYIFILPGGPGANHSHYKEYACLLGVGNVVFHDPRGCGCSAKSDPATYTLDNYIQDVEYIRQQLGLKKIILVGKSYGAICAIAYTLRYPEAVSQLVLSAGSPSFRNLVSAKACVEANGTEKQKKICEKLWSGTFTSDDELADYYRCMSEFYSYRIKNHLPVFRPLNNDSNNYPIVHEPLNCGFSGFLQTYDFENQLHLIQCPTLILVGKEDWITGKEYSEIMKKRIPNSELKIFENASHSMEIDVPHLYFPAILSFIAGNQLLSQYTNCIPPNEEHQSKKRRM